MTVLQKAFFACVPWLAVLGCAGTETGNPGRKGKLAISARSSDDVKVSLSDAASAIRVDTALISLDNVAFVSCSGEAAAPSAAAVLDLTDDNPMQHTLQRLSGDACGVQFDVVPPAGDASVLGEYSVLLAGTRSDGTPFEVRSRLEHTVTLASDAPFAPGSLILAFDLAVWLDPDEVHSAVLHEDVAQIDDQANPELLSAIDARLDLSAELFVDQDDDGRLDASESDPVARSE